METGARRSGSRIFIVMLAILAFTLVAVGAVLIATGRLCITSSHRPVDRYEGASGAGEAGLSADLAATVDADADGIADNGDVLAAALAYIQIRPHYKSVYYPSGYPDDEHGVCTDVVAIACREAVSRRGAFASHPRIALSTGTREPPGRAMPASPPTPLPRLTPTPMVSPTTVMSLPLPSPTSRPARTTRASMTLQAIPMTTPASAPLWLPSRAGRRVTTFRHSSRPTLGGAASAPLWLPSRAGRRVTTFRHSSRPTLGGVQRPMRSRFRIRRSISAARTISRSFSMLMRSTW